MVDLVRAIAFTVISVLLMGFIEDVMRDQNPKAVGFIRGLRKVFLTGGIIAILAAFLEVVADLLEFVRS